MHAREIRDLETNVILDQIEAKRKEMYLRRLDFHANKLEDTNEIRKLRKDLARMLTVLHERQLAAEVVAREPATKAEPAPGEEKAAQEAAPVEEAVETEQTGTEETEGEADNA